MKTLVLSALFCAFFIGRASCQQNENRKYVRIMVAGVNTSNQSFEIDDFIRNQTGVFISRMDKQTHQYLGIYDSSTGLSSSNFRGWIEDLGYTTGCIVEGVHGNGEPVKKLNEENCKEISASHIKN